MSVDPDHRAPTFPGARTPDRQWRLEAQPGLAELRLALHQWGRDDAPPLILAHGGSDFARTFDGLAPRLADAGWRVVSWDHRGHGDSDRAALYSWRADLRDALRVVDHVAAGTPVAHPGLRPGAVAIVGHSKGGGLFSHLAAAYPERFTAYVNIDGIPRRMASRRGSREKPPLDERIRRRDALFAAWLDHRRAAADKDRRPGTLDELAERRARMNPRLSMDWLRYLVGVGGTRSEDGWRWNLDPVIRMGGIGPWRPDWGLVGLDRIEVPMLAILGRQREPMGWGNDPDEARADLPPDAELEIYEDSGHFVHIEHPDRVAKSILEFLDRARPRAQFSARLDPRRAATGDASTGREPVQAPGPTRHLRHARLTLALHRLRGAGPAGGQPPLLLLPGLGETVAALVAPTGPWSRETLRQLPWDGELWALDWSGHGASQRAAGGGYSTETLVGDVDAALAELGPSILLGRGLGAYVALLTAGARPREVLGAVLADGPGLDSGSPDPLALATQGAVAGELEHAPTLAEAKAAAVDPMARLELCREVRPPGYVQLFVRQALALGSGHDGLVVTPELAHRQEAPPWLEAVCSADGVRSEPVGAALERWASASRGAPAPAR